jgi:hypothetical protein
MCASAHPMPVKPEGVDGMRPRHRIVRCIEMVEPLSGIAARARATCLEHARPACPPARTGCGSPASSSRAAGIEAGVGGVGRRPQIEGACGISSESRLPRLGHGPNCVCPAGHACTAHAMDEVDVPCRDACP